MQLPAELSKSVLYAPEKNLYSNCRFREPCHLLEDATSRRGGTATGYGRRIHSLHVKKSNSETQVTSSFFLLRLHHGLCLVIHSAHDSTALLNTMHPNCTVATSLGSLTRGTANITTAPQLTTTTNSSAASFLPPSSSRVASFSTLSTTITATPIPPTTHLAEQVKKIAMDSNQMAISPISVLSLLIVLFIVIPTWYLSVRFMFLGSLRRSFRSARPPLLLTLQHC